MINKQIVKALSVVAALGTILITGACGGTDPTDLIADPQKTPNVILPLQASHVGSLGTFSPQRTGFDLFSGLQRGVRSPVDGLISNISTGDGGTAVTILHNEHYAAIVSRLFSTSVRVGDKVNSGDAIGSSGTTTRLSLNRDGSDICPYSYLDKEGKDRVNLLTAPFVRSPCAD